MNKFKKICISTIFFIILIFINNKVSATNISVTPSEPKVGDEITVTVTVPNVHTASVTAKVSGVVSGTIKVVGGDMAGSVSNLSNSAKFKCNSEGNINIDITSDSSAVLSGQYVNVSAHKTVTVKAKATTPSNPTGNTNTGTTTTEKSKEARLRNLGIKPNDFSGFKRDKTEYSVEVPNNVTEVNVYATPVDQKAKVAGTGKVSLKEGKNTVKVTVTAEAGNTKTYTINITRKTAVEDDASSTNASDASLKSLGVTPKEYDFSGFEKNKTEYNVKIPKDVKEIEVYAEATSSKAKVKGTGKIQLKDGENTIKIEVTAEDGTKKTYIITIVREDSETVGSTTEKEFGLSSLQIANVKLTPEFKTNIYEYKIETNQDINSLDIKAVATDEDAKVEILKNESQEQDENIVTILVTNDKTGETATYQIIVNKAIVEETVQTSWLKPSTWGKEEYIKISIITVLTILIIIATILKIKLSKEKKSENDLDFPGADELDKALAEHQELTENQEFGENQNFEWNPESEEIHELEWNQEKQWNQDFKEQSEFEENQEFEEKTETDENQATNFETTNYLEDIARSKNYDIDYQDSYNDKPKKRKGKHF